MPRPGVEPGRGHRGGWDVSTGADRADAAAADPSSSRAPSQPSTAAPGTRVVLAALVRRSSLPGQFRPFLVCQTGDHRCLHIRCLSAVPRVAPRGTAQGRTVRLPPPRPYSRRTQVRAGRARRGNRPQRKPLRCQEEADREVVQAPPAGPTRRRPGMSSAHADLPQVAGTRLHRRSVATDHRSRAGKFGCVIVAALTPAGGLHESVQVGVPPTTSPGRRGGGLTLAATCVGAPLYFPTPGIGWRRPGA
ncbi:hypothetical protein EDD90_5070 [Streptomyces sp. Ag109_O5-1]|nr:hypothetical protein EDD90_5070 [Streptomyces sp. Ag109_O5-1]